ncbi:hypothetical protein SASPL_108578 [Salvia splendens]|uniref:RNase H type-1 domain-containing protein n=1 Tax=Salvia splendens TaxID=180675 RepID=A0A8X8YDD6_SALSN|nr:hypothetical protein SASPL_108578 [Salvia splendens]
MGSYAESSIEEMLATLINKVDKIDTRVSTMQASTSTMLKDSVSINKQVHPRNTTLSWKGFNPRLGGGDTSQRSISPKKVDVSHSSYRTKNGRVGLGVIFRDEKRMVVFPCKTELRVDGSTTLMEGIVIRYGLNMALLQNISKVYVQCDNQNLIRGLHGDVDLDSYSEVVKDDILAIARRVDVVDFQFIPRACNRVTHL